ncbi:MULTISPECIES: 2-hydroxychromene-2-carboxylate isomerase [unclassified Leisingera]|uniref:2-hydroxychromene-2-carboxylate isomerase n=1 Tax=unclassified Leisingera TaxID=2614906 RepID=UPI0002EBF45F|nr:MULTISPECIES: 2-hydroxychromene-2-carboxylate isomerase [unclassified Leisingera]KIC24532.1 DSBA oxidoreductase [Leisingera sp. ANG-S3]KIC55610.1 DSBA oxidoreductase [Leisingera sp. ANG-S]KID09343.1 DSBA oxidoreductase [Leisingera sp. ANG1]
MTGGITFWFEFASTYSYLSVMRIGELAAARGVAVTWKPFLLGPIFAAQGWDTSPFNIYPAKGRYMWRDMERICAARGLPFSRPAVFPQNGLMAARLALAAAEQDRIEPFTTAAFQAQFGTGKDIADETVLQRCLSTAGLDRSLMQRAQAPDIKSALRTKTDEAIAAGIFGAPSFTSGAELFWGDDRLEQALEHAAGGAI